MFKGNMSKMLKQAQEMQKRMETVQNELGDIVIDADSCVTESNSFAYEEVTGVEDVLTTFSIYPNPLIQQTTVDFGRVIKKATISVVDVYGKQIESYIVSNANKYILKRNNKASGIYFVEIEVGEVKLFTKIIIE
mgnify:CR=1 FL=1